MAIEYRLYLDTPKSPAQLQEILCSRLGTADETLSNGVLTFTGGGIYGALSVTDEPALRFVVEDFHIAPRVGITFRLDKFNLETAQDSLVDYLAQILLADDCDLALLFNGETVVLRRHSGDLLLREGSVPWTRERHSRLGVHYRTAKTLSGDPAIGIRSDKMPASITIPCTTGKDVVVAVNSLAGADLSNLDLHRAELGGQDLAGARLDGAILRSAWLEGADLSQANLVGAKLMVADLRRAKLVGARLANAGLNGADLSDADLRAADLTNADVGNANLEGSNLRGTILNCVRLELAKLSGATADSRTIWPDGFDAEASGVSFDR